MRSLGCTSKQPLTRSTGPLYILPFLMLTKDPYIQQALATKNPTFPEIKPTKKQILVSYNQFYIFRFSSQKRLTLNTTTYTCLVLPWYEPSKTARTVKLFYRLLFGLLQTVNTFDHKNTKCFFISLIPWITPTVWGLLLQPASQGNKLKMGLERRKRSSYVFN